MVCSVRTDNGWLTVDNSLIWYGDDVMLLVTSSQIQDVNAQCLPVLFTGPQFPIRTRERETANLHIQNWKLFRHVNSTCALRRKYWQARKRKIDVAFAWRWSQNSTRFDEFMIALRRAISQQIWLTQRSAEPCDVRREFTKVFGNKKATKIRVWRTQNCILYILYIYIYGSRNQYEWISLEVSCTKSKTSRLLQFDFGLPHCGSQSGAIL